MSTKHHDRSDEVNAMFASAMDREAGSGRRDVQVTDLKRGVTANAIAAEAMRLAKDLRSLSLLGDHEKPDLKVAGDVNAPEPFVGIEIDGLLYAHAGAGDPTAIVVRRKVGGRHEHALLDENGMAIKWHMAAPPPSQVTSN